MFSLPDIETMQAQLQAEAQPGRKVIVMHCAERDGRYVASRAAGEPPRLVFLDRLGMRFRAITNEILIRWALGYGDLPVEGRGWCNVGDVARELKEGELLPQGRWTDGTPPEPPSWSDDVL